MMGLSLKGSVCLVLSFVLFSMRLGGIFSAFFADVACLRVCLEDTTHGILCYSLLSPSFLLFLSHHAVCIPFHIHFPYIHFIPDFLLPCIYSAIPFCARTK
jgi:hypothetical protein